MPKKTGHPVLCDLGEARYGGQSYTELIQPLVYRAPEVLLDMPWTFSADIWNAGVMAWHLFHNEQLFKTRDESGQVSTKHHLASMIDILGTPPLDFTQRSETCQRYFDKSGQWLAKETSVDTSLEAYETKLEGGNKTQFLTFMRKMLQWVPEQRHTAKQLLDDPWLHS